MQKLKGSFHLAAAGTETQCAGAFREAGFKYYKYFMARGVNPLADMRMLLSLVRLCRRVRPQIIHSFDTKPCVFARIAGRIAGVPVVIGTLPGLGSLYSGGGIAAGFTRLIYENLQRIASRVSDLTIFQNHQDAGQFAASGIVPSTKATVVLGSGVRTDLFDPATFAPSDRESAKAAMGLRQDALLVTMVSRVIRSKGVKEFGAAAQKASIQNPMIDFLLVGPRDDGSVDRLTLEEVGQLNKSVTWVGARTDIPAILAASDIFVLPSFYREGIPRVLLEAASMGLPIITTDSPGCNEVVANQVNGLLVPMRDSNALADAILGLASNAEMRHRFGLESRQRAVERFDLSKTANCIRSIYRELIAGKAGYRPVIG